MEHCNDVIGPDCGNVCDVVYYVLCDDCHYENDCHKDNIDHYKMLDCALKYLVDRRIYSNV